VWGGQLFIAGEIVARKRPRGRPRKIVEPEPAIELPTREVAAA
jgi:WhiB family redox-sensing transcriptional regulator